MRNIVVLHIASLSFDKASGLTTAVPSLVSAQNSQNNVSSGLVISNGKTPVDSDMDFPVFRFNKDFFSVSLEDLNEPFNQPDLVVFHSTYIPINAKIAKSITKKSIPYVIVPAGGMTRKSQNNKPIKKMLGNILFFNKMVKNALAIHCLTNGESDETKHWGKDIFVVGNGMDVTTDCTQAYNKECEKFKITFIGRLDPYHKGLDLLIEACALIIKELEENKCIIEIYGPDRQGSVSDLSNLIKKYKLEKFIKILPPVFESEKNEILKKTHVFVHTSRFEGHPMSVLEALSYGIPCLLTPGTNLAKEVSEAEAGWEVQPSPKSISEGIKEILKNKEKLDEMSKNARRLIVEKHTWDKVAINTVQKYKEILN